MGTGDRFEAGHNGHNGFSAAGNGPEPRLVPVSGDGKTTAPAAGVAKLLAVGVGGGGVNAVNHMIQAGVRGVDFVAMNTDAQALEVSRAPRRLRLGETLTRGLGAGGNPEIGRRAAEESYQTIREALVGADMVFVTAGMGGGTGTGASPLVAQAAREAGALAVAVVTTPFAFERKRKLVAQEGVAMLRDVVDALIVVPNERLTQLAARDVSAFEAYRMADDVLRQGIQGVSDLITIPGLINLDFADIRAVMADAGTALMAVGQASGENRAETAAKAAITNPLLDVDISGARGIVFNITASDDLTMSEVDRIAEIITAAAQPDATITFGTVHDSSLSGSVKVTVVATGFEPRVRHLSRPRPVAAAGTPPAASGSRGPAADQLTTPPAGILVQRPVLLAHPDAGREPQRDAAILPAVKSAAPLATDRRTDGFVVAPATPVAGPDARGRSPASAQPPRTDEQAGAATRASMPTAAHDTPLPRTQPSRSRESGWSGADERVPSPAGAPRTDERSEPQRVGARRLDARGAGPPGYAPRPGAALGQYQDEELANDEPEYDDHQSRWGLGRIFARH